MDPILKDPRLTIRAMAGRDIESVMAIERRTYEFPWTEGIFRDCIKAGYHCAVYTLNQLVIGYGVLSVAAGEAHILNISIEPRMQGKGLGSTLLAAIEGAFAHVGRFELFTGHKSLKNLGFYGRRGYGEFRRQRESAEVTLIFLEKFVRSEPSA